MNQLCTSVILVVVHVTLVSGVACLLGRFMSARRAATSSAVATYAAVLILVVTVFAFCPLPSFVN